MSNFKLQEKDFRIADTRGRSILKVVFGKKKKTGVCQFPQENSKISKWITNWQEISWGVDNFENTKKKLTKSQKKWIILTERNNITLSLEN